MSLRSAAICFRWSLIVSGLALWGSRFCVPWFYATALLAAEPASAALGQTLSVPLIPQEKTNWCWAASSQMVMCFLIGDKPPYMKFRQCIQAGDKFMVDCCGGFPHQACDRGTFPDFAHYGFTATPNRDKSLPWDEVVRQIAQHKPFVFSWRRPDGTGHMAVAIGHLIVNNSRYIKVNDPAPVGTGWVKFIPFEEYVYGPGPEYIHWNDFFDIARK